MFLHHLSGKQKSAFLKVALFLIRLDGVVDMREEVVLEWALRDMGLGHKDLPPCPAQLEDVLRELAAFRGDAEASAVLLIEAVRIGASDHIEDQAQSETLAAIAERLGVSAERLQAYTRYALRLQALIEEGQELVGDA